MTGNDGMMVLAAPSVAAGARLFWQRWLSASAPKAIVLLVHGYAEHSARYTHVAARLNAAGYGVYALDHWGHGRSDGQGGFVPAFSVFVDGVRMLRQAIATQHPDLPCLLLGHSLGGLIAAHVLLRDQDEYRAAALSGPAIKAAEEPSAVLVAVSALLARFLPKLGVLALDAHGVSRDPDVVQAYVDDPMVYSGKMGARLAREMLLAMAQVQARAGEITLPLLIQHGGEDRLTALAGSEFLHAAAGSVDKTLRVYDGLYHEIFNEPEQDAVLTDLVDWLDARVAAA
jgi:alpha-beta hydrolase superfamily lysophospholipase